MRHPTPTLYPWFRFAVDAHCWLPVFILYFSSMLDLQQVLVLEAVYYCTIVVCELPSGMIADRFGRRATLICATLSLLLAYGCFAAAHGMTGLVVAQMLLAVGLACKSGADTALHCDSLEELGLGGEYPEREARVARLSLSAGALAALLGGILSLWDYRWAYLASAGAAAAGLLLLLLMREPHRRHPPPESWPQLLACLHAMQRPSVAWLCAFSVLMCVLMHIPYLLAQPLMERLCGQWHLQQWTGLTTGVQAALSMGVASIAAGSSAFMLQRFGTLRTLLSVLALQVLVLGLLSLSMHPFIAVIIILRVIPKGLMTAPLNVALTARLPQELRASCLSLQSLFGRLAFSAYLLLMSLFTDAGGSWLTLQFMLLCGLVLGAGGMVALLTCAPQALLSEMRDVRKRVHA